MLSTVDLWLAEHVELALPYIGSSVSVALAIACVLALARVHKLKLFAVAAKKRLNKVCSSKEEYKLVMDADSDLALA